MPSEGWPQGPAMTIEVRAGGDPAGELIATLDSVLAAAPAGAEVRLILAEGDPRRELLTELLAADPRLSLAAREAAPSGDGIHVVVPARARLSPRSLETIRELLAGGDAGAVEAAVPVRLGPLARTALAARIPGARRLRAEGASGAERTLRLSARRVGLGSARAPASELPPPGGLGTERAEHLRHRARQATNRAWLERSAQRLARERMRYEHQRARAEELDRRLAAASPAHRLARLARRGGALALAPIRGLSRLAAGARSFAGRGYRFGIDLIRRRRSPAPREPR